MSTSNPNLSSSSRPSHRSKESSSTERRSSAQNRSHKVILPLQSSSSSSVGNVSNKFDVQVTKSDNVERLNHAESEEKFQYVLAASTSLATKISDPTITYLNQGQAYELRLKKLGDISSYRRRLLRCIMRICFHERRLQYMEAEQLAEWRNAHPGERILDLDLPLSYGILDPVQDPNQLNMVSFKWDPTRDTGAFIKVNCISTEFTPKKHGGEKGVPFRLQVETYDGVDVRLHAAACILQVFKLKGADRKHKQDRDKIGKRPPCEQEKFAPSCESTVLTNLSIENIYVPPTSRPSSPPVILDSPGQLPPSSNASRDGSPGHVKPAVEKEFVIPLVPEVSGTSGGPHAATTVVSAHNSLSVTASAEMVTQWLSKNRYGSYISSFRNFNGRDMLRLMRDEIIALCGLGDGIRLYNDLHMMVVAPRTTFYVARKNSQEYSALFLEDLTVQEFVLRLAQCLDVSQSIFDKVFIVGPYPGVLIKMTDAVVQYTKPETVFHFIIRQQEHSDLCNVILENVTPLLEVGTNELATLSSQTRSDASQTQ